jgi:O-antigen ligase
VPAGTSTTGAGAASAQSGSSIPVWDDVRNVFDSNRSDSSGANARWRLAYWHFLLDQTLKEPVLGVGFGKPADFRWRGTLYDPRRGNAADPNDITPPHNSFLNVFYRTGLLGLIPLLVLVALGLWRGIAAIRRPDVGRADQALLAGFVAVFVFASFIALFNVALENPYIGLFFWTPLAALFVLPRLIARGSVAGRGEADAPGAAERPRWV